MRLLERKTFVELAKATFEPCISLYLSGDNSPARTKQLARRLEKTLEETRELLRQTGHPSKKANKLIQSLARCLSQNDLFEEGRSLCVFLGWPDFLATYTLSASVEDTVRVGQRFHLRPLLSVNGDDGQFYVLALSRNRVRVFEGTRETLRELYVEGLPKSFSEALSSVEHPHDPQFRSVNSVRQGKRTRLSYMTQGKSDDSHKADLSKYFRAIDKKLSRKLRGRRNPLVFMGVEYYFPLYRQVNSYPYLIGEAVNGSPVRLREKEIHSAAWKAVQPYLGSRLKSALTLYDGRRHQARTRCALDEVVRSAYDGRVEVLFVARDAVEWGHYDEKARRLTVHATREPGDHDLLDVATAEVITHGGEVFPVSLDSMPAGGGTGAAVLRGD